MKHDQYENNPNLQQIGTTITTNETSGHTILVPLTEIEAGEICVRDPVKILYRIVALSTNLHLRISKYLPSQSHNRKLTLLQKNLIEFTSTARALFQLNMCDLRSRISSFKYNSVFIDMLLHHSNQLKVPLQEKFGEIYRAKYLGVISINDPKLESLSNVSLTEANNYRSIVIIFYTGIHWVPVIVDHIHKQVVYFDPKAQHYTQYDNHNFGFKLKTIIETYLRRLPSFSYESNSIELEEYTWKTNGFKFNNYLIDDSGLLAVINAEKCSIPSFLDCVAEGQSITDILHSGVINGVSFTPTQQEILEIRRSHLNPIRLNYFLNFLLNRVVAVQAQLDQCFPQNHMQKPSHRDKLPMIVFHLHNGAISGANIIAGTIMKCLSDYRIIIFSMNEGPYLGQLRSLGYTVCTYSDYDILCELIEVYRTVFSKNNEIIVFCNSIMSWPAVLKLKQRGYTVNWILQESYNIHPNESLLSGTANEKYCKKSFTEIKDAMQIADQVISTCEFQKKLYLRYVNSVIIYSGIDFKNWDNRLANSNGQAISLRKHYKISLDDLVVLTVGAVCPRKNQLTVVKVAKLMKKRYNIHNLKFIIVGVREGRSEEEAYVKLIKDTIHLNELQNDIFVINQTDPAPYYNIADFFLFPSNNEALAQVVIEAANAGLAIVSTNVAGMTEILTQNESIFYHESADINSFSQSLAKLVLDAKLRKSFSMKAKVEIRKKFSCSITGKKYRDIIDAYNLETNCGELKQSSLGINNEDNSHLINNMDKELMNNSELDLRKSFISIDIFKSKCIEPARITHFSFINSDQNKWDMHSCKVIAELEDAISSGKTLFEIYEIARMRRIQIAKKLGHREKVSRGGFGVIRLPFKSELRFDAYSINRSKSTLINKKMLKIMEQQLFLQKDYFSKKGINKNIFLTQVEEKIYGETYPDKYFEYVFIRKDKGKIKFYTEVNDEREALFGVEYIYPPMSKEIYYALLYNLNTQFAKLMNLQGNEFLYELGILTYELVTSCPLNRGSSAVTQWIFRSIAKYKSMQLGSAQIIGIPYDVFAQINCNKEDYANLFRNSFINRKHTEFTRWGPKH